MSGPRKDETETNRHGASDVEDSDDEGTFYDTIEYRPEEDTQRDGRERKAAQAPPRPRQAATRGRPPPLPPRPNARKTMQNLAAASSQQGSREPSRSRASSDSSRSGSATPRQDDGAVPPPEQIHCTPSNNMDHMMIKNLDTGEVVDLREAEKYFPEVAQVMTLADFESKHRQSVSVEAETARYTSKEGPEEKVVDVEERKDFSMMKFFSRVKNAFSRAGGSLPRDADDNRVKLKKMKKKDSELHELRLIQEVIVDQASADHTSFVWCLQFSHDGNYMATAGSDSIVRVWTVAGSPAAAEQLHKDPTLAAAIRAFSPASSEVAAATAIGERSPLSHGSSTTSSPANGTDSGGALSDMLALQRFIPADRGGRCIVIPKPYRMYSGHKQDVIDLSWSKANFLLSSSVDKTVRLWHVSRRQCLCMFKHADFVTGVQFHPIEDRFFVSACFDKKLRIWNIPDTCVVEWAQCSHIITSVTFSPSGKMAVAGLHNGQCVFYQTEGLKYFTQIDCKNRHGRHKKGKKVTGLEFTPDGKKLLVTTGDSRIRLYDMDDFSCIMKFKGLKNEELLIRASITEDQRHVICGSEDACVYQWSLQDIFAHMDVRGATSLAAPTSVTRPHAAGGVAPHRPTNDEYESFKASSGTTTCARLIPRAAVEFSAPAPPHFAPLSSSKEYADSVDVIVTAGDNGGLRFFEYHR